jgi:hypothetical protein
MGPSGRSHNGKGFGATFVSKRETTVATLRERLRARQAERRGLRSFTIGVSEDDLRVMAKHGYEGALSTDPEQQAQAVSRFITETLATRLDR